MTSSDAPTLDQWREEVDRALRPLAAGHPDVAHAGPGAAQALARLEARTRLEALDRVLAEDAIAPSPLPAQAISAMDGFAVRSADLATGPEGAELCLPVSADLPARRGQADALAPGTAARIMTGAPLPPGADTVIEVERTDADPHGDLPAQVIITDPRTIAPGRHVRAAGEEIAAGDLLAPVGTRVGPGLIALATTLGLEQLVVRAALRVTVLVTGEELVAPADHDGAQDVGAVRESNGTMLAAALARIGAHTRVRRSGDDPTEFTTALEEAAHRSDLVITTGGVGHGAFDVVKAALGASGRRTSRFAHVRMRPGGPQGVGTVATARGSIPVVHLPGTPVGALVGFHVFIRHALDPRGARPVQAVAGHGWDAGRSSRTPRPGSLIEPGLLGRTREGALAVDPVAGRRLAPFGTADCLVILDGGAPSTGDVVTVLAL